MFPPDVVAGLFLIVFGIIGVLLYGLITYKRWTGRSGVTAPMTKFMTTWAMVYHYTVVAWSRWAAVQWPNWFRVLSPTTCLAICALPWIAGLVQSIVEHQFKWFVPLYFNPDRYGMDADWVKYNAYGTNTYYMVCNVVLMVLPFPFYAAALMVLFQRQAERTIKSERNEKEAEGWEESVVRISPSSSVIRKGVMSAFRDKLALSAIYDYELRSSSGCGGSEQRHSLIRMNRDLTISSQLNRVCSSR
ncbi:hypothetical protein TELCIR_12330 [Teladorsagia circumcincta]|uniref:7TM GPCR serpentine receptor class x (Srx) domain-containing protein n=1 Tax=Teladorsagia circumcincta TaxID=45464 RepID=A0A2G9U6X3_TELCI|nr:hypothetical protein TELCIR_12330 [Teladorsagia circumcincta]